jgi:PAS domain S-box-containing protein
MPLPSEEKDTRPELVDSAALRIALRNTEEAYRNLFELNPLPIWVRDEETLRFLAVNRAAREAYGYTNEEFLALTVYDIRPAEERTRFHAFVSAPDHSVTRGYTGQWTHMRKDGSRFRVETWSHDLVFNGRTARLIIARDLTHQIQAEKENRFNAQRFQEIASATSDAIWDWDFEANTLWWSDSFYSLFGYTRAAFSDALDTWAEAIHPDDRERVAGSLNRARLEGHERWREEYRFRRADGTYAVVIDRGRALRDATGKPHRMVGGMSDVTEQQRLEKQHLRVQRLESIGTLAGGIAHDLNNTLAPILLAVELLRLRRPDEETLRLVDTIETSVRRSADLVRQVLTFARGVEGHRVPAQVRPILLEALRFARESFPEAIKVEEDLPAKLWTILADVTQLNQVVLNLVLNARDAMPDGGRLIIGASDLDLDPVEAGAHLGARPGPHVVLFVTDTGTGIAPEHLDHIFEPFFTTKEVGKGTGLGLSTVHTIVRQHGGFITVKSTPGTGTTFRIHLPATPDLEALVLDEPAPPPPCRGDGHTVLVIEDEPDLRAIIREMLTCHGYDVILAADGAEGVALYAQNQQRVSVVLTDMAMPIMDGAATVNALLHINPRLPILAMSGHDPDGRFARNVKNEVRRFIPKPFRPDHLLEGIRHCLQTGIPTKS